MQTKRRTIWRTGCIIGFCLLAVVAYGQTKPFGVVSAQGQASAPSSQSVTTGNGIEYHGGPIMPGPHNVYFIWYGNWSGNTATSILPDFIGSLDGSAYFNTNTTYGDSSGNNIQNTVTMAGQAFDSYSQGSTLNDQSIINIVANAMNANAVPIDSNGIYFVLTSADVDENQDGLAFCTQICGYHSRASIFSNDIKYSFVGNPDRCLNNNNSCLDFNPSPNNNGGADAMASIMAHELNETVTDPDLNAWFHVNLSGEVGDLCSPFFVGFPNQFQVSNGSFANIALGDRLYLIQSNFTNAAGSAGGCQMSFTSTTNPDYSLSLSPTSRTVQEGGGTNGTGTYQITVNRVGGFSGDVSFFVTAPTNQPGAFITAPINPSHTTGNSATLPLVTSAASCAGTYAFTLNGVSGKLTRTANLTLAIQGNDTFSISANPPSLTLVQGAQATVQINSSFTGCTGKIQLDTHNLPAGVGTSVGPINAGSSGTLTIFVAKNAPTGTFPLTVTGTKNGVAHNITIMLSISPSWWPAIQEILD